MGLSKYIGSKGFYRKLFAIMFPILIQNVITNFVNLIDNIMVGQIGTEPMTGVAIVNQFIFVFNLCIFGGLAGAGIFTAQYVGKNDSKGVADTFRAKLYIGIVCAVAFAFAFICYGKELIMSFIHEGGEVLDMDATLAYGEAYLRIILLQIPPFVLLQTYSSTLKESGETVLPMKAGVSAVLINLVGNYILIFGKLGAPALGVEGAAIATVISRYVECAVVVIWTHRHRDRNRFLDTAYTTWRVPLYLAKQIIIMGFPLLINEFFWSSGMTFLNQCYSIRGLSVVSAVNISTTVTNLFFCAMIAMGNAISIIIGQILGSGELERAVEEDTRLIAFSIAFSFVVGAIMIVLAPVFPQMYNTTDTVKSIATEMLMFSALLMPVHAFTNACYFTLRSGGKVFITLLFDSVYLWILSIPVAFVLSRFTAVAILPMFISVQLLDIIKCAIGYYMVKKRMWVKNLVS